MTTVLHLIPTLEGGGAERQLAGLALEQSKAGMDVHIGVRRGGVHAKTLDGSGVKLHFLGDRRIFHPRTLFGIWRLIKSIQPSLVQTWLVPMDLVGGLAACLSRRPWIVSERSSGIFYQNMGAVGRVRARLARFASGVIANSEGGREYWKSVLPDSRAPYIFVLRNALDVGRIRSATPVRNDFDKPLMLVVGRLCYEKASDLIVRSVSRTNEINFQTVIIGEGPLQNEIERIVAENDLANRVTLRSYEPNWWGWLKTATLLVSMSRLEGNPNVVLEAMAAGCPVILSDIPAHREIADDTMAAFVPSENIEALSEAIDSVLARPAAAKQRAVCAQLYSSAMTFERAAAQYSTIYRTLLAAPSR